MDWTLGFGLQWSASLGQQSYTNRILRKHLIALALLHLAKIVYEMQKWTRKDQFLTLYSIASESLT